MHLTGLFVDTDTPIHYHEMFVRLTQLQGGKTSFQ
jgi:hypothetical protein